MTVIPAVLNPAAMMLHKTLLAALLLLAVSPATAQDAVVFDTDRLSIETGDGRSFDFEVELAISREQQMQGLMFRETLADDAGMLFLYRDDSVRRMWMRNTLIPLDMLFIRADGTIARIARMTEPLSEAIISSREPVRAVLELRGGLTAELGIATGDRVDYPWLDP